MLQRVQLLDLVTHLVIHDLNRSLKPGEGGVKAGLSVHIIQDPRGVTVEGFSMGVPELLLIHLCAFCGTFAALCCFDLGL